MGEGGTLTLRQSWSDEISIILEEPSMSKQKDTILITGSSGRIGYPLAKRLY